MALETKLCAIRAAQADTGARQMNLFAADGDEVWASILRNRLISKRNWKCGGGGLQINRKTYPRPRAASKARIHSAAWRARPSQASRSAKARSDIAVLRALPRSFPRGSFCSASGGNSPKLTFIG